MLYAREGSPESQGGVPGGFAASARYAVGKANGVTTYIMLMPPPWPAMAARAAGSGSLGMSLMVQSVMRIIAATEAAFWRAERTTLTGSMTPMAMRSPNSPVAQLRPWPAGRSLTFSTMTEPSKPALAAMVRRGSSTALRMMSVFQNVIPPGDHDLLTDEKGGSAVQIIFYFTRQFEYPPAPVYIRYCNFLVILSQ